jgi:hypothetical protein
MPWTVGAALAGAFLAGAGAVGIAWWLYFGEALARGREVPQSAGGKAKAIIVWTEPPPVQAGR